MLSDGQTCSDFAGINGAALYFTDSGGDRRPLVFVNSLGTDCRIWETTATLLTPYFRIVRYDKRGHGLSQVTADVHALEEHVADLSALLSHLGIGEEIVVCGLSIGGMIAQYFAAQRRAAALILCCTGLRMGAPAMWDERITKVRNGGLEAIADATMERWFSSAYQRNNVAMIFWRNMLIASSPRGYIASCAALRDGDCTAVANKITAPTLCIAGAEDQAAPPTTVRALADAVGDGDYAEFAGCGHLPCIECPQQLADTITDFVVGRRLV